MQGPKNGEWDIELRQLKIMAIFFYMIQKNIYDLVISSFLPSSPSPSSLFPLPPPPSIPKMRREREEKKRKEWCVTQTVDDWVYYVGGKTTKKIPQWQNYLTIFPYFKILR